MDNNNTKKKKKNQNLWLLEAQFLSSPSSYHATISGVLINTVPLRLIRSDLELTVRELYVFLLLSDISVSLWQKAIVIQVNSNESNAETEIEAAHEAAHDEQYLALKVASVQS